MSIRLQEEPKGWYKLNGKKVQVWLNPPSLKEYNFIIETDSSYEERLWIYPYKESGLKNVIYIDFHWKKGMFTMYRVPNGEGDNGTPINNAPILRKEFLTLNTFCTKFIAGWCEALIGSGQWY